MIDFFAGMGNFRAGFEQAGFECVYSVEWDKNKRKIYEVIYGSEPDAADIMGIRGADIPPATVWCFGAPCQDFSVANSGRAGLGGNRSSLVREVFRLLKEKEPGDRPEWIVYENVKGMLSCNNGWDFAYIQAEMGGVGYDVEWQILNSKDFGVPQNRERVYTIGHFRGYGCKQILPFPSSRQETCVQQIARQPSKSRDNTNVHRVYATDGIAPTLSKMEGGGRQPFIIEDFYKSRDARCYHETAPTLRKDRQGLKVSDTLNNIRRLTPRECMRLQGVPDAITDKLIAAGISDSQMYRAAGDAVTVNVVYAVAKRIKETIKGEKK